MDITEQKRAEMALMESALKYRARPMVVLARSEAEKDVVKAYNSYVNSYILKPLDFKKFTQLMDSVGFYSLAWNSQPDKKYLP